MFTHHEIYERIKSTLQDEVNKIEGSFTMDNVSAVSQELAKLYSMEIAPISNQFSLDTAKGEYLDKKGIDFNERRNAADEDDEAFRGRILEKIQRPITGGNENHYIYWAKQVAGVGEARCTSLWNGAGTVKVIVLSDQSDVPDETVLQNVRAHIESNRLIGADVTVVAATPLAITIKATIKLQDGVVPRDMQESIKMVLQEYLSAAYNVNRAYLSYHKIGDLIFSVPNVLDILSYTINDEQLSLYAGTEEFFKVEGVVVNGTE